MFGRNGEAPVPVLAPQSPADCFEMAFEAFRIATKYMVPVFLLSDGYLANGAEPWKLPESMSDLPDCNIEYRTDPEGYLPFMRDETTLARPWVKPGTPGMQHRIGGIEKQEFTGNVSYDPANHQRMTDIRQAKVDRVAEEIPDLEVFGPDEGDLLVIGWGSTYGAIHAAMKVAHKDGKSVAHAHIRHLNPFPKNLEAVMRRYKKVVCAEMNMGQLKMMLRDRFLIDVIGLNKVQGMPFRIREILTAIDEHTS